MATAATLRALSEVLQAIGLDTDTIANRRTKWRKLQNAWCAGLAKQEEQAEIAETITPPLVMELCGRWSAPIVMSSTMLLSTRPAFRKTSLGMIHSLSFGRRAVWERPGICPRRQTCPAQEVGHRNHWETEVLCTIPWLQPSRLATNISLPLIILVFTNSQYAIMKHFHKRFYLDGVAVADDVYYGVKMFGPRYEESAAMIGGIGQRVEDPGVLRDAITAAYESVRAGKTAVLNVIMPGDGGVR